MMTDGGQPGETEDRQHLHHAEQPQRAVDADLHHPQPAQHAADHRRPQPRILGDQADIGLAKAHVQIKRRGQRRAHAVAQLVEQQKSQYPQRALPALPVDELAERLDHRVAQGLGAVRAMRLAHHQRHRDAGQHEQRGDDEHHVPGQIIGEDQRQRAGHQTGDAVGIDVHRIAQPQLLESASSSRL